MNYIRFFYMRLSYNEHFQFIWSGMDYDINAMAQIVTNSLNKPQGIALFSVYNIICDWQQHDKN